MSQYVRVSKSSVLAGRDPPMDIYDLDFKNKPPQQQAREAIAAVGGGGLGISHTYPRAAAHV